MMARTQLGPKLPDGIDRWVHFTAKDVVCGEKRLSDVTKTRLADHHHVHVAAKIFGSAGHRAMHEGHGNLFRQFRQGVS